MYLNGTATPATIVAVSARVRAFVTGGRRGALP